MYYSNLPYRITTQQLRQNSEAILAVNKPKDLAKLLETKVTNLKKLILQPAYKRFHIPKANGERRLIESPERELYDIQRKLNFYLRAVYHLHKPDCVYSFIITTTDGEENKNIYTNALKHAKSEWLLQLDLDDFFPNISAGRILRLFTEPPFSFPADIAGLLTGLCTYQEHLPTGACTSPILSNLVAIEMDKKLLKLSKTYGWTYTRFVDDLFFSWKKEFKKQHLKEIGKAVEAAGFQLEHDKMQQNRMKDEPEITGLIIKDGVPDVAPSFIKALKADIDLFHQLTSVRLLERNLVPQVVIGRFKQYLQGQINFVRSIRGENHKTLLELRNRLMAA